MPNLFALPFQVKICGLTSPQQAADAVAAGADAIGLNFYEPSVRYITEKEAVLIANTTRGKTQSTPKIVGVFVNHPVDQILQFTTSVKLDGIQLHGDETVEFFANLKEAVAKNFELNSRPFFVRALRTQPNNGHTSASQELETQRVIEQIQAWSVSGVDAILIDAAATGEFGGTGKSIDWTLLPRLQSSCNCPLALAGGLKLSNVRLAIVICGVNTVDVASGVESTRGTKCPDLVAKFVHEVRLAFKS